MDFRKIYTVFMIFLSWLALAPLVLAARYYDEVYLPNGELRPAYQNIFPIYQGLPKDRVEQFLRDSRSDFKQDNMLEALPRVLTEEEYEVLKRGTEQRARALFMFLEDHYSGRRYLDRLIPSAVIERILRRSGEQQFIGVARPSTLSFPYGPDIIRDANGVWRVIEDNPGWIGGMGDLIQARESLLSRIPEYGEAISIADDPERFYRALIDRYRLSAKPQDGAIVLYSSPPYPDFEDIRIREIFSRRGAYAVTPFTKNKLEFDDKGLPVLVTEEEGRILRKPVGFVILNGEHHSLDFTHPAVYERALLLEARSILEQQTGSPAVAQQIKVLLEAPRLDVAKMEVLLKQACPKCGIFSNRKKQAAGLSKAILEGKVPSNFTPGSEFLGDKELYLYVDKMIRYYLKQEPILKNIETKRFAIFDRNGKASPDKKLIEKVFASPEKYVVKAVDGRGGDGVWVGAKISQKEFMVAKSKILEDPERYVAQQYTHLSSQGGANILDLRMISYVDKKGVVVSGTPWGRSLPIDGDGKVNLSSKGRESAVIILRRNRAACEIGFGQIP